MKNFLTNLFDSKNRQVEAHLVLLCLGTVTFVFLSIYHCVWLGRGFEPDPYGQGLGCLLAGGGVAACGQGLQRRAEGDGGKGEDESAQ